MANSILKEVSFTPQAFEKEFNFSNKKRFRKLILILENLIESGIIITASSNWKEQVFNFLSKYNDDEKEDIVSLLKEIDDRQRIVSYPSNEIYNEENKWIEKISILNSKRTLDFVAGTNNKNIVQTVESIDKKRYMNMGAKVEKQTADFMQKILEPILAYAAIVKVFDPYFNLSEVRFKKALEIICKNLSSRHGKNNGAIIEIHTSIKPMWNNSRDKEFNWQNANSVPRIIKQFEEKYNHSITVNIWEEIKKENEWHERWLITNQCGIFIGKGSDISDWTDSTWGLLDWEEIPKITSKFNKNRSMYNFIGEINSTCVVKNQNPKNTPVFMTEQEKIEENKRQEERIKDRLEKAEKQPTLKKKTFNKITKKWELQ
jgi:hypothetical protein